MANAWTVGGPVWLSLDVDMPRACRWLNVHPTPQSAVRDASDETTEDDELRGGHVARRLTNERDTYGYPLGKRGGKAA